MTLESNDVVWNIDMEVNLFHAMRGHKPAGVNRHFQMLAIHDKLSCKKVTSEDVWKHLSTLYDLQALNESEILPFPNKPGDFDINDDLQDLTEKTFPRTTYINFPMAVDTPKNEVTPKSISKMVKSETKFETKTPVHKSETRNNTPTSQVEKKSAFNKSLPLSGTPTTGQVLSPKRTKRTRNLLPVNSPVTPTEPSTKRRR